jgi:hypothetical protein
MARPVILVVADEAWFRPPEPGEVWLYPQVEELPLCTPSSRATS